MNPAGFMELDLDAIGRVYDVNLALVIHAMTELEENLPQPVAAVLEGRFLVGVVFRVEGERQEQLAADIGQPVPKPGQDFEDAHRMKP
jgi:hypothetical protein